jgi:hypothetical protein
MALQGQCHEILDLFDKNRKYFRVLIRALGGLFDEKTRSLKSHDTVPLRAIYTKNFSETRATITP